MKVDSNWKEVHVLAEDMDLLLGVPVKTSEKFLEILSKLIIHKFVESVLEGDEAEYQITLPYLGNLIVSFDERKSPSIDFHVRPSFYKAVKSAYLNKVSPLVEDCTKRLGEDLVKRYDEGEDYNG